MRPDARGLFYYAMEFKRPVAVAKPKRTPPERVWEHPDYLPGLEVARQFPVKIMTTDELVRTAQGDTLLWDCEVYGNYFLIGFRSYKTGKAWYCEIIEGVPEAEASPLYSPFNTRVLNWIFENCTLVGFNSRSYDATVTALALAGYSTIAIKQISDRMIQMDEWGWQILRGLKVPALKVDHVDLIEVAPLSASLKTYAGRLHAPFLQDLPFAPDTRLSYPQIDITRWYCVGKDLTSTAFLKNNLDDQLKLRTYMSGSYGMDLRSKSDAQVAMAVIAKSMKAMENGKLPSAPFHEDGTTFYYKPQDYMVFETPVMKHAFETVCNEPLVVNVHGRIPLPPAIEALKVELGINRFRMGIGGLHSSETSISHYTTEDYIIEDVDATSYYPFIILNQQLYPQHLGKNFLNVFGRIVEQRVEAKRAKRKADADSLKITINGTFGNFGNPHAIVYAPDLMLQTTLTGQLSLLLLAEWCVLNGIDVLSGNTDGLTVRYHRSKSELFKQLIADWERATKFTMESVKYKQIHFRDVNNYIAIGLDGKVKGKGVFANPWSDPDLVNMICHKNPVATICVDAITKYLKDGMDYEKTVRECTDIRRFVVVRNVKGGAVLDGIYLGKVVRWYHSTERLAEMVYALSGNRVATSDGGKPCMDLPTTLPPDIDYNWYIQNCKSLLASLGVAVP